MQADGPFRIQRLRGMMGVLGVGNRGLWGVERVGKLREEPVGYGGGCSKIAWETVGRHVKGAEEEVPEGKEARKVFVQCFRFPGMVPSVEHGRGDDLSQRAEVPVEVCMQADGVKCQERRGSEGHLRVEPQHENGCGLTQSVYELVQRVNSGAGNPVEFL